jgi:phosphatidate phosphatase PAH1
MERYVGGIKSAVEVRYLCLPFALASESRVQISVNERMINITMHIV